MSATAGSRFPGSARFAFTVVDDTDFATVDNVSPVYELLHSLGMRTTKTLWPLPAQESNPYTGSQTAADPDYLEFLNSLRSRGFELALHGVRMHSSARDDVEAGLARFERLFGAPPAMHVNHFKNLDNVYWGRARLSSPVARAIYRASAGSHSSLGHVEGDKHFWGDICRRDIRYVRSFTYRETNLDRLPGPIAYSDPSKPYVNGFFLSTEGGDLPSFLNALGEDRQDRLAAEGGVCIMYTHFGAGFAPDGQLDERFESLIRRLAGLGGWFPTATELLDHLYPTGPPVIRPRQRARLERRWLMERLRYGSS